MDSNLRDWCEANSVGDIKINFRDKHLENSFYPNPDILKLTCGDAVERLRFQVINAFIQVGGRTFAVNLVHSCVGAENPLHQPFQLTITCEMISS